jgi:hypothetical protein
MIEETNPMQTRSRKQEDQAKLEWLRQVARKGIEQLDRGEGAEFHSIGATSDRLPAHRANSFPQR